MPGVICMAYFGLCRMSRSADNGEKGVFGLFTVLVYSI